MTASRFTMTLLLAIACFPPAALAVGAEDYQALKLWCIERENKDQHAGVRKPATPSRQDHTHFHHYCYALNALNKAYVARNEMDRRYQLEQVIGETNYVLTNVAAGHPLLPEVHTLRGQAYSLGHKTADAERELLKALQMDPSHLDAHITLARLYSDTKRKDKAIEVVRSGLALAPDNKTLRRIGEKLGVELPSPEEKPAAVAPDAAAAASNEPAPVGAVLPKVDPAQPESDVSLIDIPIGSPTNPWCRFCPDTPAAPPASSPSTPGVVPKDWK